jgi:hypothetical protein
MFEYLACGLSVLISSAESALFFGGLGYFLLERKLKSDRQIANLLVLAVMHFAVERLGVVCGQSKLVQSCIDLTCLGQSTVLSDALYSVLIVSVGYLFATRWGSATAK